MSRLAIARDLDSLLHEADAGVSALLLGTNGSSGGGGSNSHSGVGSGGHAGGGVGSVASPRLHPLPQPPHVHSAAATRGSPIWKVLQSAAGAGGGPKSPLTEYKDSGGGGGVSFSPLPSPAAASTSVGSHSLWGAPVATASAAAPGARPPGLLTPVQLAAGARASMGPGGSLVGAVAGRSGSYGVANPLTGSMAAAAAAAGVTSPNAVGPTAAAAAWSSFGAMAKQTQQAAQQQMQQMQQYQQLPLSSRRRTAVPDGADPHELSPSSASSAAAAAASDSGSGDISWGSAPSSERAALRRQATRRQASLGAIGNVVFLPNGHATISPSTLPNIATSTSSVGPTSLASASSASGSQTDRSSLRMSLHGNSAAMLSALSIPPSPLTNAMAVPFSASLLATADLDAASYAAVVKSKRASLGAMLSPLGLNATAAMAAGGSPQVLPPPVLGSAGGAVLPIRPTPPKFGRAKSAVATAGGSAATAAASSMSSASSPLSPLSPSLNAAIRSHRGAGGGGGGPSSIANGGSAAAANHAPTASVGSPHFPLPPSAAPTGLTPLSLGSSGRGGRSRVHAIQADAGIHSGADTAPPSLHSSSPPPSHAHALAASAPNSAVLLPSFPVGHGSPASIPSPSPRMGSRFFRDFTLGPAASTAAGASPALKPSPPPRAVSFADGVLDHDGGAETTGRHSRHNSGGNGVDDELVVLPARTGSRSPFSSTGQSLPSSSTSSSHAPTSGAGSASHSFGHPIPSPRSTRLASLGRGGPVVRWGDDVVVNAAEERENGGGGSARSRSASVERRDTSRSLNDGQSGSDDHAAEESSASASAENGKEQVHSAGSEPNSVSSRRQTVSRFALVDPQTGLPFATVSKKRASAVYMGMLPDTSDMEPAWSATAAAASVGVMDVPPAGQQHYPHSHHHPSTSAAVAAVTTSSARGDASSGLSASILANLDQSELDAVQAQLVLQSLSPLHSAVVNAQAVSVPGGGGVHHPHGAAEAVSSMLEAMKVERAPVAKARVAPTLMQQAKLITAAIIMQKQTRIAERRAILQKRQQEQDAAEAQLEQQHAEAEAAARAAARARDIANGGTGEYPYRDGRTGTSFSYTSGSGGSPHVRHSGSGSGSYNRGSGGGFQFGGGSSLLNTGDGGGGGGGGPHSARARHGNERAFSYGRSASSTRSGCGGAGEGRGDDDEDDESDRLPVFKPSFTSKRSTLSGLASALSDLDFSGAGTAWSKENRGNHLLREARLPSQVNASAANSTEEPLAPPPPPPVHSSGFGTGSSSDNGGAHHPLMNPSHPNFLAHFNPNSSEYNAHLNPRHKHYNPLNNPQHPRHDTRFNNPRSEDFNPFYGHPKLSSSAAVAQDATRIAAHQGLPEHPAHPSHPLFTPYVSAELEHWLPADSSYARDLARARMRARDAMEAAEQAQGVLTAIGGGGASGGTGSGPSSPRNNNGFGGGTGGRQGHLTPFQIRRLAVQAEKEAAKRAAAEAAAVGSPSAQSARLAALAAASAADWEAAPVLDLSPNAKVPLERQLEALSHRQLEQLRRETINAVLGQPGAGGKGNGADGVGMSQYFRDTLARALGGDEVWQMAKELHLAGKDGRPPRELDFSGVSLSALGLQAHMSLFGAGALTDSDGRPVDAHGNYLDVPHGGDADDGGDERNGNRERAVPIAPFPPRVFFLDSEVERYEAALREQLRRDHEQRVRDYEDMVNRARRKWNLNMDGGRLDEFHEQQANMRTRNTKAEEGATFLAKPLNKQRDVA